MVFEIKKVDFDGVELLPDITETPLWAAMDVDRLDTCTKHERTMAALYQALWARENYYQENSPTAFGNPDYAFLSGVVSGLLQALEAEENEEDERIVIRRIRDRRKLLVVDKLQRPQSYFESQKENRELRSSLGL